MHFYDSLTCNWDNGISVIQTACSAGLAGTGPCNYCWSGLDRRVLSKRVPGRRPECSQERGAKVMSSHSRRGGAGLLFSLLQVNEL